MNKLLMFGLLSICFLASASPSQALLGEDYKTVKNYFCRPKPKDAIQPCRAPELLSRMTAFTLAQKDANPQAVMMYANGQGLIEREQWLAAAQNKWSMEQADKIRSAIMGGQSAAGVVPLGMENLIYYYANGSRIYYYIAKGRVYSVLAVAKTYNPGDRSKITPLPYEVNPNTIIRPRSF